MWTTAQQRNIRAYSVAPDGSLTNGRIFGEEPGGKGEGVPDGIKVDKNGNLFVTGPGGIWVWNKSGNHLGTILLPEQPANLAWGDKDYSTLYITATTSVYRLQMKTHGFGNPVPQAVKRLTAVAFSRIVTGFAPQSETSARGPGNDLLYLPCVQCAICWKRCPRRQDRAKILRIHVVKRLQVRRVVQVHGRRDHLIETHSGFFQVVEEIAHRLPELMRRGSGIDATVRARNESTLGRAIQSVAGKNAGACGRAGRHILRAHRFAAAEDRAQPHRCIRCERPREGSSTSIVARPGVLPNSKRLRIVLIHHAHGNRRRQVGIDENHIGSCPGRRP